MKFIFESLVEAPVQQGPEMSEILAKVFTQHLATLEDSLIQDLRHISDAAKYNGGLQIDAVTHLKDNLYRCDYSYDWDIAWTCSGTQESGRVSEKVRFTLDEEGVVTFKFLTLDA
ncbi:hypothetical protein [Thiosulfativibrio zosterae]|uniref:Uncharacterized protein n=1 Tax=Thiosulfativibrio zosterae TaxID=2675053 RepID=A0A6F8PP58_9GAMM|nr:hypothetical protein [Thiosulfativibrio zosterae]BBP43827.1 hypothetical protein THMIRHAT_15730 [Thiosulfativibrio zosterae]